MQKGGGEGYGMGSPDWGDCSPSEQALNRRENRPTNIHRYNVCVSEAPGNPCNLGLAPMYHGQQSRANQTPRTPPRKCITLLFKLSMSPVAYVVLPIAM